MTKPFKISKIIKKNFTVTKFPGLLDWIAVKLRNNRTIQVFPLALPLQFIREVLALFVIER
jgi:hypothetical protein